MSHSVDPVFDEAVIIVFEHEGGLSMDPRDSGNWTSGHVGLGELKGTNFGISAESYGHLDIRHLTKDEATDIYYRDWWVLHEYADLPPAIAGKVFDLAVGNPAAAHRALQRAIRAARGSAGGTFVPDDGIMGPTTIQAAKECNPDALLAALRSEFAGYVRLVGAHKLATTGQPDPFMAGWLIRAYA